MYLLKINLSTSTTVLAGATLLGALAGSSATLINRWLNRRSRRRNLRRALLAELRGQHGLERFGENDFFIMQDRDFPRSVYYANVNQIGELTQEEVEAIVGFYSLLKELEQGLEIESFSDYELVKSVRMKSQKSLTPLFGQIHAFER